MIPGFHWLKGKAPWTWCVLLGLCATSMRAQPNPAPPVADPEAETWEVGLATVDITPEAPIFLAGYASRRKPSEGVDTPLMAQAMALRWKSDTFVMVALDNCEVSRRFMQPVLERTQASLGLARGSVMVVSSHTHSAPMLTDTLEVMAVMPQRDREVIQAYSHKLQSNLFHIIKAACEDLKPSKLARGMGTARFAINRRVYRPEGVQFGENPEGPHDWEVPVMRITDLEDRIRAIVFGYACHGTSIAANGFYLISGEYMAHARQHIESVYPDAVAMFLTGMGADQNPTPRGDILEARRHGLELAGAVVGALQGPMSRIEGPLRWAYSEVDLALKETPDRTQLEKDLQHENLYVQRRAQALIRQIGEGHPIASSIPLPMSVVRLGHNLSFLSLAGEVVVDYALEFKRLHREAHPWCIGYAYEVPCYIPNTRILKEGGYEADSSLIYYGIYGPFQPSIQETIHNEMSRLLLQTQLP